MSIRTVRDKLKERLETIDGLTASPYPPNAIPRLPHAIVDWDAEAANYAQAGNATHWRFVILLLLAKFDAKRGYEGLDDYVEKTGDKSIKAQLELGSDVGDWVYVTNCRNPGLIEYRRAGQQFYGAEFIVLVGDTT